MKEWHRTIILVILIIIAVGFLIYLRTSYDNQALLNLTR